MSVPILVGVGVGILVAGGVLLFRHDARRGELLRDQAGEVNPDVIGLLRKRRNGAR